MNNFLHDIKYGARMLWKSKGFTAVAVVALALGIGANTAVFSVADAFLLKPLPFPEIGRLVMVQQMRPGETMGWSSVSPANLEDWRKRAQSFEKFATSRWYDSNLSGEPYPESVQGFEVTGNFFETLGLRPQLGRTIVEGEDTAGQERVVVLSDKLWKRRFGGDAKIVGREIQVEGKNFVVVGVMGAEFDFPKSAELWMPMVLSDAEKQARNSRFLMVTGRLKPGVTQEQARAEMRGLAAQLAQEYPETNRGWGVRVMSMRDFLNGDYTTQYTLLLLGAVGFVLLIACANVAILQFARGTARRREIAVRTALGAGRGQLLRQLLTESVLLAMMGAAAGLIFAQWSIETIVKNMPPDVAKYILGWYDIRLDWRALVFTLAVAVLSGIVAGLVPALGAARPDLNETLKEGGRSTTAGRGRHRIRNAFVVAQVTLSLVLLIGAGLMVKGVRALVSVNANYRPESLLTARVNLPDVRYKQLSARVPFYDQVLERVKAIPGVEKAALAGSLPYGDGGGSTRVYVEGKPVEPGRETVAWNQPVSPEFFSMLGIPLREGRLIGEQDGPESERAVVISESLARREWPKESPLGRKIRLGSADPKAPVWTVVGVVGDIKYQWEDKGAQPAVYRSYRQFSYQSAFVAVKTSGDPLRLGESVRAAVASVDSEMPVFAVMTQERVIRNSVVGLSYVAVMLSVMGALALVLACVGVYSMMSHLVGERIHEIGVRMTLGAQRSDVLRLVLRRGMLLTGIGLALGLPAAAGMARLLANLLFGVSATDVETFGSVSILLAVVAVVACYVPARRAMKVDPIVALRYE